MIRALPILLLAALASATTHPADLRLKFLSPGELAVSPEGRREAPKLAAFRQWMIAATQNKA